MAFFRRVQNEERVYDHAVRVERTFVVRNRVGIAAVVDHVVDRDDIVAYDPAAFACLGNLDQVVLPLKLCLGLDESA